MHDPSVSLLLVQFSGYEPYLVGDDCVKGTPVPIPNTEVKLIRAEDTWRAAARENRALPTQKTDRTPRSVFLLPILEVLIYCLKNVIIIL